MKSVLKSFLFMIIFILWIFISVSIVEKYVKIQELRRVVSMALDQTQRVQIDQRYVIASNDEYIAEFSLNLIRLLQSSQDIDIEVYGVDYQKGLLDVCVKRKIYYPLNKVRTLSVRKTSIIEEVEREG